jgi:hypothetical protein
MVADAPALGTRNEAAVHTGADANVWNNVGTAGAIDGGKPLASPIRDFYLTNPIARASVTMAECSRTFVTGASKMAAE